MATFSADKPYFQRFYHIALGLTSAFKFLSISPMIILAVGPFSSEKDFYKGLSFRESLEYSKISSLKSLLFCPKAEGY